MEELQNKEWGNEGKEKYGGWLGIVYIDTANINDELIDQGHAEEYK